MPGANYNTAFLNVLNTSPPIKLVLHVLFLPRYPGLSLVSRVLSMEMGGVGPLEETLSWGGGFPEYYRCSACGTWGEAWARLPGHLLHGGKPFRWRSHSASGMVSSVLADWLPHVTDQPLHLASWPLGESRLASALHVTVCTLLGDG